MSRYVVFGGFLGSGKTTSMMAFSDILKAQGKKPAILVNDLGARNLVDGSYTEKKGYLTQNITGDCICYQTENLVDKLRRFRDADQADLIFSDIPGCGIGALDHVYHKLDREYHGEFTLCPFTAVVDPERLRVIMPEHADLNLPSEMEYLFDAQLKEAEVILLNKIDLLTPEKTEEITAFLKNGYPEAAVFAISAKEGTGLEEALAYLMTHDSELRNPEIGYGGPDFVAAEETMSWYNRQFYVKGGSFDGNAFTARYMDHIRDGLRLASGNVPHLKAMAEDALGHYLKVSLTGVDYALEWAEKLPYNTESLKVIVNARAACESGKLDGIMDYALKETVKQFGLSLKIFFTECFGMMDEGRAL